MTAAPTLGLTIPGLETVYDTLASAIDQAGPEKAPLFLVKLALLNAHALGLYNLAYNLATLPNTLLLGALQPAFMAAGAQLQTQQQRLGHIYVQMLATVLVLVLMLFSFLIWTRCLPAGGGCFHGAATPATKPSQPG